MLLVQFFLNLHLAEYKQMWKLGHISWVQHFCRFNFTFTWRRHQKWWTLSSFYSKIKKHPQVCSATNNRIRVFNQMSFGFKSSEFSETKQNVRVVSMYECAHIRCTIDNTWKFISTGLSFSILLWNNLPQLCPNKLSKPQLW